MLPCAQVAQLLVFPSYQSGAGAGAKAKVLKK